MYRRTFLACCASSLGALAGCSDPERSRTPTQTTTPNGEERTPTPNPDVIPASRTFSPTAVASDGYALTAERWFTLSAVYHETDDGTETIEPTEDVFVGYDFTLENRGDAPVEAVPDSEFRLQVSSAMREHLHAFAGVTFAAVTTPPDRPEIRPLSWYERLHPGESVRLQLVFDAPAYPNYRQYLAWDHTTHVEGHDDPVYVYPARS